MRDLDADLKICEAATPGPWKWITKGNAVQSRAVTTDTGECGVQKTICASISPQTGDADFITAARIGWPEAIERAMKAELELSDAWNTCDLWKERALKAEAELKEISDLWQTLKALLLERRDE